MEKKSKLKVGMTIMVMPLKRINKVFGNPQNTRYGFNDDMYQYLGKKHVISEIRGECIKLRGNCWSWHESMFMPLEGTIQSLLKNNKLN